MTIEELCKRYNTGVEQQDVPHSKVRLGNCAGPITTLLIQHLQGLSKSLAAERLIEFGPNALTPPKKTSPILRYLQFLSGIFNIMLLVAGALSFVVAPLSEKLDTMSVGT